jgi:hypothetical protein
MSLAEHVVASALDVLESKILASRGVDLWEINAHMRVCVEAGIVAAAMMHAAQQTTDLPELFATPCMHVGRFLNTATWLLSDKLVLFVAQCRSAYQT